MADQYRREAARPIAAGRNDATNPILLEPGETPDDLNCDYDRGSVASAGGVSKFNNQTAPRPGVRVGRREGRATLPVLPGKSVPLRGSVFIPYSETQDVVGADYTVDTNAIAPPKNRFFGRQRGKSFELQVSFRVPEEEKLYAANHRGQLNSPTTDFQMLFGADEALDEFFAVVQKGGDRMTPMSWALGVVNTGQLFDTNVGGGLNIFGLSTATHSKRRSNYALCFMWLDAPAFGVHRPVCARYRLSSGSVWFDVNAAGEEIGHLTAADGAYPTFAYRAMIVPFFVEPGEDVHVALALALDTGTSGTTWNSGTGELSGVSWNGNGSITWHVARGWDAVETFTSANGAGSQVLRYKGPTDSLEYLCKYGVRYHGRDAMHVGLGYRFAPWQSGGFIPFGIDSCPTEYGGFQITDHSVHGPLIGSNMYPEYTNPEEEVSGASVAASLAIEYSPAVDAGGTKFGISYRGLVNFVGAPGHDWGNETGRWANVDPVFGKSPWAYDQAWSGLGGLLTTGFNPEALKGYRLVFLQDNGGFATANACGGLISIDTYTASAFGAYTYGQYITAEGGDQFPNAAPNPTLAALASKWMVGIRAFRWNQRELVVSDLRLYSSPRTWSVVCDFTLRHELDLTRAGEPGLSTLRGHWAMSDGGGYELAESIIGNAGLLSPMAGQQLENGGVFLSGEGEALYLNLAENPDFREQLRAAQGSGFHGCAIQVSMRLPEAQYAIAQRVNNELGAGGASSYYHGKFAPDIATWNVPVPDRRNDLLGTTVGANEFDHIEGRFSDPMPLLEFGHNVYVENAIGVEPFAYPMSFSLRAPTGTATDFRNTGLVVPGTGLTGLHAWHRPAGTNVPRWDRLAAWVGRDIVIQFGLEPTGTADTFTAYIAAWPKEFLNPETNDPSSAEFALISSVTLTRRQVERSVIVIGGAWNPRVGTVRKGAPAQWKTLARAAHECNTRMIVTDVRVFGAAAPGSLPATNGGIASTGAGKIVGDTALPLVALSGDDLAYPVAGGNVSVNFTQNSRTVSAVGAAAFSQATPQSSRFAVLRCFLAILGDKLVLPKELSAPEEWPRTYFISAATASSLTLNRPVVGTTRRASGARAFRVLGYSSFSDELTIPVTVGRGRGYDLATVSTRNAQVTAAAFENASPIGVPWRWRVYSAIPSGSSQGLLPTWDRGIKCSTWNSIRGLHGVGEQLYVGAQGSLFEADDRWRASGPTDDLTVAIALRARAGDLARFPAAADRVVFASAAQLQLGGTWAVESGVAYLAVADAWVKPATLGGVQTILWCGRLDSNPLLTAGSHGIQFWTRLSDGYPELVIGSNVAGPSRGLYVARGSRRLSAGEWAHVRWGILGVLGPPTSVDQPVLWINGRRVSVSFNASDAGAAAGAWLAQSGIQYDASHQLVLGAARDAITRPTPTQTFTAAASAASAPILPTSLHGWLDVFDGELAGVVCTRVVNGTSGFDTSLDFDPRSITYLTRRFSVLEQTMSNYGVGERMLDAGGVQFGTIFSHPLISITHSMGSDDAQWSFAQYESDIYCANGGRVGIIDAKDGSFRFAGIQAPRSLPTVDVVRSPLWKANTFVHAVNADNGPIFNLQLDSTGWPTNTTPAVPDQVYHYNIPGTGCFQQASHASMNWVRDSFFAFKCYFQLNSVTGRIQLFGRRDSVQSGTFIEVRDGYLYAGWWDTNLKQEVSIRTDVPVIEPGYVYYLYYRKWFPRGGLATGHNAQTTKNSSNWANSLHCTGIAGTFNNQACYDSFIWRRFPRAAQSGFFDFTGWDAKSYDKDTDATAGWGGAANYDYLNNSSSARACVSAVAADSQTTFDPYATIMSPTGLVMLPAALNGATTGDVNGRVQISTAGSQRFLADHVGMLLQVAGGTLNGQVYRIVEFISATSVKCVAQDGTPAPFNVLNSGTDTVAVYMGCSLVKSDNYDQSVTPDPAEYAIEVGGSSLQANPLNGMTPFDGELWSMAWHVSNPAGQVGDDAGNLVCLPEIFETATAANVPNVPVTASRMSCAVEVGTDLFGLQGTGNTRAGVLPYAGEPAGELNVDAGGVCFTAVDTVIYYGIGVAPFVCYATAPASTKPNATKALALDAVSNGAAAALEWVDLNPVVIGTRRARLVYYDPEHDVLSGAGEELELSIPVEDINNPSAAVSLVFSNLPACPDGPGFSTRIYLTPANSTVLFLRAQVDDGSPDSINVEIDEVNATNFEVLDPDIIGAPPDASFVCVSQGRMFFANLAGQADGVMFSLPFFPEIVSPANIFPANTGRAGITGLVDFKGALVVFKRDAIIPVKMDTATGFPLIGSSVGSDGCVSARSIAALEDRIYYVSDRGPHVLLEGWQPFFIGKRCAEFFKRSIDEGSFGEIQGSFNRRRGQYVWTVKSASRARMDERFALEFQHPTAGEDVERAEMAGGHRLSLYRGAAICALGQVQPRGAGAPLLVGGTDQGFVVWMDRRDHRMALGGPVVLAGATPAAGDRTFTVGVAALAGSFNRTLEGHMGQTLRAYANGEHEAVVLFTANDGTDRVYLEGPLQEAMTWLASIGAVTGDVVSMGAALWRWSSKQFDFGTVDQAKTFYALDVTRRVTAGALKLDLFRDAETAPRGSALDVSLAIAFQEIPIQAILQRTRAARALLRTQTPAVDVEVELLDLVWRLQETDNRP